MSSQESSPQVAAHPIPQEAFDWYDEYAHGVIDRRIFMARLGTLTTASLTMGMLLPVLMPDYEAAEQVSFNDGAIKASYATFPHRRATGKDEATWSLRFLWKGKLRWSW